MVVMPRGFVRRSLEYTGIALIAVTAPVAILAFTILKNNVLAAASLTGSFIGAVLVALAPAQQGYAGYSEWVSENSIYILRSLLEQLGLREYKLLAYPSTKAGGEACILYAPRNAQPPESLSGGLIVRVGRGFGLKLRLRIPSDYIPGAGEGGGEALASDFTTNYLGAASSASIVEANGCYVASMENFNPSLKEYVEAAVALILAESSNRVLVLRESRFEDGVLTLRYCGVEG